MFFKNEIEAARYAMQNAMNVLELRHVGAGVQMVCCPMSDRQRDKLHNMKGWC